MSVPPFVYGAICLIVVGTLSDRWRNRGYFVTFFLAPLAFAGFCIHHFVDSVAARYFALFLTVAGGAASAPHLLTWAVDNSAGLSVKAVVAAYTVGMGGYVQSSL
jgi:hypothetical protein